MDRPNPSARPQRSQLKLWRSLKLAEIWKALKDLGNDAPKGTSQRKARWRRGEQLAAAKKNRTKRRHARRRLTKKLQHNRAAKSQNLRTGSRR